MAGHYAHACASLARCADPAIYYTTHAIPPGHARTEHTQHLIVRVQDPGDGGAPAGAAAVGHAARVSHGPRVSTRPSGTARQRRWARPWGASACRAFPEGSHSNRGVEAGGQRRRALGTAGWHPALAIWLRDHDLRPRVLQQLQQQFGCPSPYVQADGGSLRYLSGLQVDFRARSYPAWPFEAGLRRAYQQQRETRGRAGTTRRSLPAQGASHTHDCTFSCAADRGVAPGGWTPLARGHMRSGARVWT